MLCHVLQDGHKQDALDLISGAFKVGTKMLGALACVSPHCGSGGTVTGCDRPCRHQKYHLLLHHAQAEQSAQTQHWNIVHVCLHCCMVHSAGAC